MTPSAIHDLSVSDLARCYRDGSLSPVETTRHLLGRIQKMDPSLKAFITLTPERALAEAQRAEWALAGGVDPGPLCGIPYAVKDLFDVRGVPTMAGTRLLAETRAAADAATVQRLTRAGMILLGKTRTVQFAYGGVGINHDQGTPHNTWQVRPHVPGGSSSGSAVAVASGMVPAALGTDTAGSVRIPASLCGLVGLKTTFGRVSRFGVYPLSDHLDSIGPLTRAVEDAARIAQVLQGSDPRDEATRRAPARNLLRDLKNPVPGLKLALAETPFFKQADPAVASAVRGAAVVFQELGVEVLYRDLPEASDILADRNSARFTAAETCVVNASFLENHQDELDPVVARRMLGGKDLLATEFIHTWRQWISWRQTALKRLRGLDALLVPATAIAAAPLEAIDRSLETYNAFNGLYLRNTFIGSVLGWCGVSLPCGFTENGLPVGLMLYGKPFQEATILRLAYAYEQATDWHLRRPDLAWTA